jgi:signal transduction histidine kinase
VRRERVATIITGTGAGERVWARAYDPGRQRGIYLSDSLADQERELSTLRSTLLLSGLAATAVAALIGVALAASLTARLRRAAGTARRIAAGELGQRVRLRGNDEVASLARALDEMAESLEGRIDSERQFAADAAHELRTPLAGVVAASQLLPEGRPASIVREGVEQLRRLVEQLLELARLDGGLDAINVDLVDLQTVARSAQGVYASVLVDAPASSLVATDLRRLERIIANLVENALRYGAPPVTIHVDGRTVAVSDRGQGFAAELLPRATRRFSVGDAARSKGIGLGLAITAEHARVLRARLDVANRPEGGGIVTVELVDLESTNGTLDT